MRITSRNAGRLAIICLLLFAVCKPSFSAIPDSDRELIQSVSKRLLAVADPVAGFEWPPTFEAQDGEVINAYAEAPRNDDGKHAPKVIVTEAMLKNVIEGDADRLAFVIGHEIGHIILRHVVSGGSEDTPLLNAAFTRDQEIAADKKGVELLLKAGFSYKGGIKAIKKMMDLNLNYSSFEGLGVDHPSWTDRLVFIDTGQSSLWQAMSAFQNGSFFLLTEQYPSAIRCFKNVTEEFPSCHEAWTNLGYARLMQYCDALDQNDLKQFGIGQIVCGGFYRRPQSLESQVRGIDEELWWDAVGALREALRLKPELALAKANLGIAYLVRPAGKDVGQASKYLQEAADAAASDKSLDLMSQAAIQVNAGVADFAGGQSENGRHRFDEGERLSRAFAENSPRIASNLSVPAAISYNRALLLAQSSVSKDRIAALPMIEQCLRTGDPSSAWWNLSYERYVQLSKETGHGAKTKADLQSKIKAPMRILTSVELGAGRIIMLSESIESVSKRFGPGNPIPVVQGTNLVRISYPEMGIQVLGGEQVIAITLMGAASPGLKIRPSGLAAQPATLRVGMSKAELESALDGLDYDYRQLDDPQVSYRFYRSIGLAARLKTGIVDELVVVQIPERSIAGI